MSSYAARYSSTLASSILRSKSLSEPTWSTESSSAILPSRVLLITMVCACHGLTPGAKSSFMRSSGTCRVSGRTNYNDPDQHCSKAETGFLEGIKSTHVDKGNGEDHECCEEEVYTVRHREEHLRCEARNDECE